MLLRLARNEPLHGSRALHAAAARSFDALSRGLIVRRLRLLLRCRSEAGDAGTGMRYSSPTHSTLKPAPLQLQCPGQHLRHFVLLLPEERCNIAPGRTI